MSSLKDSIGDLNCMLQRCYDSGKLQNFKLEFQAFVQTIDTDMLLLEQNLNLLLFLWLSDDFASFPTLCHKIGLSELRFETRVASHRYVTVLASGVVFEPSIDSTRAANRKCLSHVFKFEQYGLNSKGALVLIEHARLCSKYVCKLAEEWEFQNVLMAIKQVNTIAAFKSGEISESSYATEFADITKKRNDVAVWCLSFLTAAQKWIGTFAGDSSKTKSPADIEINTDFLAEIDALDGIVLAAFQKILLPGSVSRHLFSPPVRQLFLEWCQLRLHAVPHDTSTLLAKVIFQDSLDLEIEPDTLQQICNPSDDFNLDFDPTTALKSVIWRTQPALNFFLTMALGLHIAKKRHSSVLHKNDIDSLVDVLQIAETFPTSHEGRFKKNISLPAELSDYFFEFLNLVPAEEVESKIFFEREIRKHFESII